LLGGDDLRRRGDRRIDDELECELGARDCAGRFRQVRAENPLQEVEAKTVGRGDAQRRAARLHPHAAAEPDRMSFFTDPADQSAMHGRHDLPIVPGHFLTRLLRAHRAPKTVVSESRYCGKNRNRLPARQR
jgi:hypothetical protein